MIFVADIPVFQCINDSNRLNLIYAIAKCTLGGCSAFVSFLSKCKTMQEAYNIFKDGPSLTEFGNTLISAIKIKFSCDSTDHSVQSFLLKYFFSDQHHSRNLLATESYKIGLIQIIIIIVNIVQTRAEHRTGGPGVLSCRTGRVFYFCPVLPPRRTKVGSRTGQDRTKNAHQS